MKKLWLIAVLLIAGWSLAGCSNFSRSEEKPSTTTGYFENREERMRARIEDLNAKGYSKERAKQVASKQVPVQETTYTESLASILTGRAQKEKAEQESFEKNLAKSASEK